MESSWLQDALINVLTKHASPYDCVRLRLFQALVE